MTDPSTLPKMTGRGTPGPAPAALEIVHLSHSYGARPALRNVSFSVRPASFCILLGLNGAGKSTLFSLITRLYAAPPGTIRIFGFDVNMTPSAALRQLGVVFQARTLDLDLTVRQNLLYHASLHGISAKEALLSSQIVLERTGMSGHLDERVRTLSGGQIRRIEIARALLHHPPLLLLDEATAGLDIKARADILAHVRYLVAEAGVGVLWATHLIDEVTPADDVVVIHAGRILDQGLASEVTARAGAAEIGTAFTSLVSVARKESP
ncbi:MAG TPA: ATP-binding cassette domain-containing protein [Methylocella sp.]|nr:ATP-binding cassette domain-containing protein [Methylocella sp.]